MSALENRGFRVWAQFSALALLGAIFCQVALAKELPADLSGTAAVTPLIEIDRPVVMSGDGSPLFVLIRFKAADFDYHGETDRPPVHLSLVLDRSGSMEDVGKIEYLKSAAKMAIDRLTPRDRLAIIEYDDVITVMWPSAPVESTFPIKRLIDGLEPRGSTNLVGGMMRGVDEIAKNPHGFSSNEVIRRVLLLSDGLANQGVTDPREIGRLVRSVKSEGIRISTMGLGRDYDEDLMQAIAENGGGNYYYIEHPTQMARIFEQELQILFTTVAKDVTFRFEPSQGIKKVDVVSLATDTDYDGAAFDMENFYAGESRAVLLRLEPDQEIFREKDTIVDVGTVSLSYFDVRTGQEATFNGNVTVEVTDSEVAVANALNNEVIVEARLVAAEKRHADIITQYESGNYEAADDMIALLEQDVTQQNASLKDARLANKIEALRVEREQMARVASAPADRSAYLKSTKQRLYKAQQGKRNLYRLQTGDKGLEVERLQQALTDVGHYAGPVDGIYSQELENAVQTFQTEQALTQDGVAGPATMQALGLY